MKCRRRRPISISQSAHSLIANWHVICSIGWDWVNHKRIIVDYNCCDAVEMLWLMVDECGKTNKCVHWRQSSGVCLVACRSMTECARQFGSRSKYVYLEVVCFWFIYGAHYRSPKNTPTVLEKSFARTSSIRTNSVWDNSTLLDPVNQFIVQMQKKTTIQ